MAVFPGDVPLFRIQHLSFGVIGTEHPKRHSGLPVVEKYASNGFASTPRDALERSSNTSQIDDRIRRGLVYPLV